MHAVWHRLPETRSFHGHVLFMEEDHLLFPNALLHLSALLQAKELRCPACVAVNLAPSDVTSRGEPGMRVLVRERMGNVGYAFNRSVWEKIHAASKVRVGEDPRSQQGESG